MQTTTHTIRTCGLAFVIVTVLPVRVARAGDEGDQTCAERLAPGWCQGARYADLAVGVGGGYARYGHHQLGPLARLDLQLVHGCEGFMVFEQISVEYARELDPGRGNVFISGQIGVTSRSMLVPSIGFAGHLGDTPIPTSNLFVELATVPLELWEFVEPEPEDHTMFGVRIFFRMMVGLSSQRHAIFHLLGASLVYSTFTY